MIGKSRFTIQSDTHIVMMQIDNALPRMCIGKTSVAITNFNGPRENAKKSRNNMIHSSIPQPLIPYIKQKPVNANATAAQNDPTR
ncbi:hypothetical protein D3C86_1895590 [compost metagenome]